MKEYRTVEEDELEEVHRFDKKYVGSEDSLKEFKGRYEEIPDSFVVCVEDGEILADATGKIEGEDTIGLQSIGVKEGYKRQGIGSEILNFFEQKAEKYADKVTLASADNIEDFYRANDYKPVQIMLQVKKTDLPKNYREKEELVDEKEVDSETVFLYAEFDEYSKELRDRLKEKLNAFEVNTIYEKKL